MGSANSKASKTSSEKPLKPTVSIGTPHPDSVARWKRESTQASQPTTTASDGQAASSVTPSTVTQPAGDSKVGAATSPSASISEPAKPAETLTSGAKAVTQPGAIKSSSTATGTSSLPEKPTETLSSGAKAMVSPGATEPTSSVAKAAEPSSAPAGATAEGTAAGPEGVQQSAVRENPIFEDETPATTNRTVGGKEAAGSSALSPSSETSTAAKTAVKDAAPSSSKAPVTSPASSSAVQDSTPASSAPVPSQPKAPVSEIQPDSVSTEAKGSVPTSQPKTPVSEITPDPVSSTKTTTAKPAAQTGSTATKAAGAAAPVAAAVPKAPVASKSTAKGRQDKVAGGGCFGCFGPSKKFEPPKHDPARPSIGTPTGFVEPTGKKTTEPVSTSTGAKTAAPAVVAPAIAGKSAITVEHEKERKDLEKPVTEGVATPGRVERTPDQHVTSPKTPEKLDLPSTEAPGAQSVTGPATPEQLSPATNLPSSVSVGSKPENKETLSSINRPVIAGSGLFPMAKDVHTSPETFEEPLAERETIKGDLDQNSVSATRAIVQDTQPDTAFPGLTSPTAAAKESVNTFSEPAGASDTATTEKSAPSEDVTTEEPKTRAVPESRIPKPPMSYESSDPASQTASKPILESQAVGEAHPADKSQIGTGSSSTNPNTTSTSVMLATVAPEVAEVATAHKPQIQEATQKLDAEQASGVHSQAKAPEGETLPIAAVAPEVAEIAAKHQPEFQHAVEDLEKDTTPAASGFPASKDFSSPESTALPPLSPTPSASSLRAVAGSPAPQTAALQPAVDEATEKRAVAAALRHGDIIQGETIHPDDSDPALADALQKQNVAKALREEAAHQPESLGLSDDSTLGLSQADGNESAETASVGEMSTLVEPGTPRSKHSGTQTPLDGAKEASTNRGADLSEAKIGEAETELPRPAQTSTGRKPIFTAVHDNPEYESTPADATASKVTSAGSRDAAIGSTAGPKQVDAANSEPTTSVTDTQTHVSEPSASAATPETQSVEVNPPNNAPISPLEPTRAPLTSSKSSKTFAAPELPEATPETLEKEKKQEAQMQKAREREEKAKEKLRQKSLKKRNSRGFLGIFGGSSKKDMGASAPTGSGVLAGSASQATSAAPQAAASAAPTTAAPQVATAAAAPVQSGSSVAVPLAAGIGAGAATGVATGVATSSIASRQAQEPRSTKPSTREITPGPATTATPVPAPLPTPEVIESTPLVTPAQASIVPATTGVPQTAEARAPTQALSPREIQAGQQPSATPVPAATEPAPSVSAFAGAPTPPPSIVTAGSGIDASRANSAYTPSGAVTPAEVALEQPDKKVKKAKSKKLPKVDHSAAHMAKTPSVRQQKDSTALQGRPSAYSTPGVYSPLKSGNSKLQTSLSLTKQQSLQRQPSGQAASNAAPRQSAIQSLNSMEFKGPKAPMGKGTLRPEVSYARNYRPMSTATGGAVPTQKSRK